MDGLNYDFLKFVESVLLEDEKIPVIITINSNGGDFAVGVSIYNIIKALPNPVYTLITRQAVSSASLIAIAAPKAHRFTLPNSRIIFHPVRLTKFQDCGNKFVSQLQEETKTNNQLLLDIVSYETDIGRETLQKVFMTSDDEMLVLNTNEMQEKNVAKVVKYYRDFKKIITQ